MRLANECARYCWTYRRWDIVFATSRLALRSGQVGEVIFESQQVRWKSPEADRRSRNFGQDIDCRDFHNMHTVAAAIRALPPKMKSVGGQFTEMTHEQYY